jgi:hypothetical protein
MNIHEEVEVRPHTFWTLALGEGKQLTSDPSSYILG